MKCPINGKPCSKHRCHSVNYESAGQTNQFLVCEDCMASNPELKQADDLGPCPQCGSTLDQIVRTSRIGCSICYEHFGDPLQYIIASVQFSAEARHVGSIPGSFKRSVAESVDAVKFATEIAQKVKAAAREENYEEAARLSAVLLEVKKIISREKEKGELGPEDRAELAEIAYRHFYPDSAE